MIEPGADEQRTLTIGEAADALGVTPSWLRFGERLGSIPLARRDNEQPDEQT
jgi:hypothetical protein